MSTTKVSVYSHTYTNRDLLTISELKQKLDEYSKEYPNNDKILIKLLVEYKGELIETFLEIKNLQIEPILVAMPDDCVIDIGRFSWFTAEEQRELDAIATDRENYGSNYD